MAPEKPDQFKSLVDTVEKAESPHEKVDDPSTELDWDQKVQTRIDSGIKAVEYTASFMGEGKEEYAKTKLAKFSENVAKINEGLEQKLAVAKENAEGVVEGILTEITGAVEISAEDLNKILEGEITEEKAKSISKNKEFFLKSLGEANTSHGELKLKLAIAVGEGKGGIKRLLEVKSKRDMLRFFMVKPGVAPGKDVEAKISFKAVYDVLEISDPKSSPVAAMIENEISIANLFEDAQIQRIVSVTGGKSRKGTDYKEVTDIAKYFNQSANKDAAERKRRGLYTSENKYIPIFNGATISFTEEDKNPDLEPEGEAPETQTEEEPTEEPAGEETQKDPETPKNSTKFSKLQKRQVTGMSEEKAEKIFNKLSRYTNTENLLQFLEQAAVIAPWAVENNRDKVRRLGRSIGKPNLPEDLISINNRERELQTALKNVLKLRSLKEATPNRAAELAALILNNLDLPILRNDERTPNLIKIAVKMRADLVLPNLKKMMAVDRKGTEYVLKEILGIEKGGVDVSDYESPSNEIVKYAKDLIELGFEGPVGNAMANELERNPSGFMKYAVELLETGMGKEKLFALGQENPLFILDNAESLSGSRKGLDFLKKTTDHAIAKEGVEAHKIIMKNVQSYRRLGDFQRIIKKAADETLKTAGGPKIIIENMDDIEGSFYDTEGFFAKAATMAAEDSTMAGTVIMKNIVSIKKHIKESEKIIKKAAETMAVNAPVDLYLYAGQLDEYSWAKGLLKKARKAEDSEGNKVDLANKNPKEILKSAKSLSERGYWGRNLLLTIAKDNPKAVFMNSSEIARLDPSLKEEIYNKATSDEPELTLQHAGLLHEYRGERWFKNRLAKAIKEKPEMLAKNIGKLKDYPRATYIEAVKKILGKTPKLIVENADQFLLINGGEDIVKLAVKGNEVEFVENLKKCKGLYKRPWVKDAVVKVLIENPEVIVKNAGNLRIFVKDPADAKTRKGKLAIRRRNEWAQMTVKTAIDKKQDVAKKSTKEIAEFDEEMYEAYLKESSEREKEDSDMDEAIASRKKITSQ